eukprot:CAMPEP_0185594126 /NCGR_PEP_ID=MMETSP0434-20130131/73727_1 /TAXON_ID=626734 ORGANISM="Favella taraikaensis, Strain Fe Narragansett Bay" /NCGR_SAMPLE_ID=MMETSP0434 /ASSEMBLY_ACC=CAM_ASM_000379 /LENGTH=99 /DNA_ID=CAMNT_0028221211 /DNA_START=666 /DNA_END=965 /DNA_ORIENTATION=-
MPDRWCENFALLSLSREFESASELLLLFENKFSLNVLFLNNFERSGESSGLVHDMGLSGDSNATFGVEDSEIHAAFEDLRLALPKGELSSSLNFSEMAD